MEKLTCHQVKWNGPLTGQIAASIGEDGYFKLWEEDLNQACNSGRRFRQIMTPLASKSKLPWMSIDFKNIDTETYLALITRDGNFTILEPRDHDVLAGEWVDWMGNQDFLVCPAPPRSEEAGFKVCFHQEKLPCWTSINAGLDRRALSVAIIAMNVVKIYRTDKSRHIYLAAELTGSTDIVRDVAWSNGSIRGFDVLATAGKDGSVRVYELKTSSNSNESLSVTRVTSTSSARQAQSGIGAGLKGISKIDDAKEYSTEPSRVKQEVTLVSELTKHDGAVWKVAFSYTGDLLTSTGDDGKIQTYKRSMNGKWYAYAQIEVDDPQRTTIS